MPAGTASEQQRQHQPRIERRLPKRAPLAAGNRAEVEALPHQFKMNRDRWSRGTKSCALGGSSCG
jgi:hypothetical protein